MNTVQIVLGILLLVSAIFLIVAVLMQDSKKHGLSGAISGGAETYFGKQKGSTVSKRLSKLTLVIAIVFVVITLVLYVIQDQFNPYDIGGDATTTANTDGTDTSEPEGTGTSEPEGTSTSEPEGTGTSAPDETDAETDAGTKSAE